MFHVEGNYIRKEITSHLQTIASHFHIVIIYTHTHTYRRNIYPHTHKHKMQNTRTHTHSSVQRLDLQAREAFSSGSRQNSPHPTAISIDYDH